jgi:hypothetical protein
MHAIGRAAATLAAVSMMAAGAFAGPRELAESAGQTASGVVTKVEKAVERGAKAAASGIEHGLKAAASGVERGAKAAASGIERGTRAAASGVAHGAKATADVAGRVAAKAGASSGSAPATSP